jgi:predicted nucleic acid-binding protein
MREFLLDTSAYSALLRGHEEIGTLCRIAGRIALSVVALGEILFGLQRAGRGRRDADLLRRFLASPRVDLLDVDADTAARFAVLMESLRKAGSPTATNDVWIAATAAQHGLPIVTLDSDFERIPQILVRRFTRES